MFILVKAMPKKRNKKYRPKDLKSPWLLMQALPLSDRILAKILEDKRNRLLRLRLMDKQLGSDAAGLILHLGQAWLLAENMEECAEIRSRIENVAQRAIDDVREKEVLTGEVIDEISDCIDLSMKVLASCLGMEYEKTRDRLVAEGGVEFVDDFFRLLYDKAMLEKGSEATAETTAMGAEQTASPSI